jgi:hypothetical protein
LVAASYSVVIAYYFLEIQFLLREVMTGVMVVLIPVLSLWWRSQTNQKSNSLSKFVFVSHLCVINEKDGFLAVVDSTAKIKML